ncbi:MAG: deoxynucleoside kinase [Ruminococcus sp.]|nr:deoxynucleoside kinase [Ruminococcus sp.]
MNGKLIVIEGLDGSGKATQADRIFKILENKDENVRKVSFPDYESNSSALIKMYLGGEFGSSPDDVNPYAASSFYAVDRYASYTKNWRDFYLGGGIVIADRYTTSNAIHQCAKLREEKWNGFIDWLFSYEYNLLGIPAPAQTVYLRVDPEISRRLITQRYNGDETKRDIHEADTAYLEKVRRAADYCAEKLNWKTVECAADGSMRRIEDITDEILGLIL